MPKTAINTRKILTYSALFLGVGAILVGVIYLVSGSGKKASGSSPTNTMPDINPDSTPKTPPNTTPPPPPFTPPATSTATPQWMADLLWKGNEEFKAGGNSNPAYRCEICNNISIMTNNDLMLMSNTYKSWYGHAMLSAVKTFKDCGNCSLFGGNDCKCSTFAVREKLAPYN